MQLRRLGSGLVVEFPEGKPPRGMNFTPHLIAGVNGLPVLPTLYAAAAHRLPGWLGFVMREETIIQTAAR